MPEDNPYRTVAAFRSRLSLRRLKHGAGRFFGFGVLFPIPRKNTPIVADCTHTVRLHGLPDAAAFSDRLKAIVSVHKMAMPGGPSLHG